MIWGVCVSVCVSMRGCVTAGMYEGKIYDESFAVCILHKYLIYNRH